jgi:citronellol/citronellal dehydrogenase
MLNRRTLFITGASRGIGLAIACRAARDGANVALAAKTATPHPRLPGTIYTAAEAVEAAGGKALPLILDVRDEQAVRAAMAATAKQFGGIDILINNASAISLTATPDTDARRFDLMHQINARGTYVCTREALGYLRASAAAHVLNISPPLDLSPHWFGPHVAYSIAKFGMSLCTLGHAEEFRRYGIAVNSLWPISTIDTAAVRTHLANLSRTSRKPEIMADAAHAIITKPPVAATGQFYLDEVVLRSEGIDDFSRYAVDPAAAVTADYFVNEEVLDGLPTKFMRLNPLPG